MAFDAATIEYAECSLVMPSDWNAGTITAQFYWLHSTTTTNFDVVWGLQGCSFGNNEGLDQAMGTAQEVTDTGGVTSNLYITAATAALTLTGATANDLVQFRTYRNATSGSDTLAIDAQLLGILISFTRT